MVSTSKEEYLRTLFLLEERNQELSITNIARHLRIAKPSVTEMMQALHREKLVAYKKYAKLAWTKRGKFLANALTARHRIIESFLKDILHVPLKDIHAEANVLEHAVSTNVLNRMRAVLGNPTKDPHGKVIP
ncbi:MAG: metal-dependent transcriptional regulator [archaeon]